MKKVSALHWQTHPMVIFWIGLLTGAVVVALVFFYKNMNPSNYNSAVLKNKPAQTQVQKALKPAIEKAVKAKATKATTTQKAVNEKAFPQPTPNKTAFPQPTPN